MEKLRFLIEELREVVSCCVKKIVYALFKELNASEKNLQSPMQMN